MIRHSFKQIRLAFFLPVPSATGAAGPCHLAFANDNARLRLFPDFPNRVLRLAGRHALAQLRAVVGLCRTETTALGSHTLFVAQRIPRAVTEITSSLPLRAGHYVLAPVEAQQSPTGAKAECTASAEIVQRSTAP